MYDKFVQTSNVKRFLVAISKLEDRAAPEASWMMVPSQAGLGKTRTGSWWGLKNNAAFVRIKAAATPHWILTDLVKELGEHAPAHSCEKLFEQAIKRLAMSPRPIILDEVENGIQNIKVLESIRDISDLTETTVVALGREWVWGKLQAKPQFKTRVGAIAEFQTATIEDVRLCVEVVAKTEMNDDAISEIHQLSGGYQRTIMTMIGNADKAGRRSGKAVTADDIRKVAA